MKEETKRIKLAARHPLEVNPDDRQREQHGVGAKNGGVDPPLAETRRSSLDGDDFRILGCHQRDSLIGLWFCVSTRSRGAQRAPGTLGGGGWHHLPPTKVPGAR